MKRKKPLPEKVEIRLTGSAEDPGIVVKMRKGDKLSLIEGGKAKPPSSRQPGA